MLCARTKHVPNKYAPNTKVHLITRIAILGCFTTKCQTQQPPLKFPLNFNGWNRPLAYLAHSQNSCSLIDMANLKRQLLVDRTSILPLQTLIYTNLRESKIYLPPDWPIHNITLVTDTIIFTLSFLPAEGMCNFELY